MLSGCEATGGARLCGYDPDACSTVTGGTLGRDRGDDSAAVQNGAEWCGMMRHDAPALASRGRRSERRAVEVDRRGHRRELLHRFRRSGGSSAAVPSRGSADFGPKSPNRASLLKGPKPVLATSQRHKHLGRTVVVPILH